MVPLNIHSNNLKAVVSKLSDASARTKQLILLFADFLFINIALVIATALRLEELWPAVWHNFYWLFIAIPLFSLPVFFRFGLYRTVVRHTSIGVLWGILVSVFVSFIIFVLLLIFVEGTDYPRSIPIIYFFLATFFIGGSRLVFRHLYRENYPTHRRGKRVLLYGAGSSGRQMVLAFQNSPEYTACSFVDDNEKIQGRELLGISVNSPKDISLLVESFNIDFILLAIPSISFKRKKEILNRLKPLPVEIKSLPSLDKLVDNDININHIQDIQIDDLLGRDPVPPQINLLHLCIKSKNVLVTGAGGTIGSELCRQIAANEPRCLVLFEQSEFALYTIEAEMRAKLTDSIKIVPVLGSVTHKRRLLAVIRALEIQTIYHAAAYKHVPMVEYNPIEGVRNNVFGTFKAAQAANEGGVETFVLISTDKAVRPTNVMGASKRMAELVLQAFSVRDVKTRYTMVRFGNVLGSSGSVVPHFHKQIKDGGPVTVTHPDVVRYFMTIPEAVQLVIQAGAMGNGGDVFVLDMGEPVKIVDLAKNMIKLCGRTVRDDKNLEGDIEIQFCGLRPGEKLFEELLVGTNAVGTSHPMIMRAEERMLPWTKMSKLLIELDSACCEFDYDKVRSILLETVDGYVPQCGIVDPVWLLMEDKIRKGSA